MVLNYPEHNQLENICVGEQVIEGHLKTLYTISNADYTTTPNAACVL